MTAPMKGAAALAAFALLECALFFFADRPLALAVHNLDASHHALIEFFRSITDYGKSAWYLWPCGVTVIATAFLVRGKDVPQHYRQLCGYIGVRAFFLFATIAVSGLTADLIKPVLARARPILWLRDGVYGFSPFTSGSVWASMPSGHTTTVFTLACALTVLYPRGRIIWFAYALVLAASRIMVDAHYLSDVVAGAALGWATVTLLRRYGINNAIRVIFPIDSAETPL
ncbi:MAG: phosphatase PAP2 family protein [Alphaproteobacteria bacterium]|nr:phosphatase PAP2 family protein [Alphaproteobacteria bacterium]